MATSAVKTELWSGCLRTAQPRWTVISPVVRKAERVAWGVGVGQDGEDLILGF